jgi:hypothetical protein
MGACHGKRSASVSRSPNRNGWGIFGVGEGKKSKQIQIQKNKMTEFTENSSISVPYIPPPLLLLQQSKSRDIETNRAVLCHARTFGK